MVSRDLEPAVERAVRGALTSIPFETIEIREGVDQTAEEALFITVTLPAGSPVLPGATVLAAMTAVSDAVLGLGELRFPYLHLHHAGEQVADDSRGSTGPGH